MATEIKLPQLGQTMEEGTVVNCLVKEGDHVKRGDVIFEIETDKATLEMESPNEGFVKVILAQVDQTLLVGASMMILGEKDEEVTASSTEVAASSSPAPAPASAEPSAPATPAPAPASAPAAAEPPKRHGRIMASPRARRIAKELGVDLATVTGTGPVGKITEKDIRKAAEAKPTAGPTPAAPAPASAPTRAPVAATGTEPKLGEAIPVNRLQRITAERMLKSKLEIPCFYLTVKVDATNMVAERTKLNASGNVKIAFNDFIIKAVALGLEKFPIMTGQLLGDQIQLVDAIHVGLAISVPDGLIAPLVRDVAGKTLAQVARDSQSLIERTRADKLDMSDLEGGCITVSNLGAFGIESFIPIVVPGQCTILGVGQISDACVPDNGNILVRKMMNMTLSVDHKVANGAYAAQFLDFVRKLLEDPSSLI